MAKPHLITYQGKTQCLTAWAKELGMSKGALTLRLKRHPLEVAMTIPKRLPPQLHEYEGKMRTVRDIAAIKGVRPGTIRRRLHRSGSPIATPHLPPTLHEYKGKSLTKQQIADAEGVGVNAIKYRLRMYGVVYRKDQMPPELRQAKPSKPVKAMADIVREPIRISSGFKPKPPSARAMGRVGVSAAVRERIIAERSYRPAPWWKTFCPDACDAEFRARDYRKRKRTRKPEDEPTPPGGSKTFRDAK